MNSIIFSLYRKYMNVISLKHSYSFILWLCRTRIQWRQQYSNKDWTYSSNQHTNYNNNNTSSYGIRKKWTTRRVFHWFYMPYWNRTQGTAAHKSRDAPANAFNGFEMPKTHPSMFEIQWHSVLNFKLHSHNTHVHLTTCGIVFSTLFLWFVYSDRSTVYVHWKNG